VAGCDDWGDETSALCGTKRHTFGRPTGCWAPDLPGEATVRRPPTRQVLPLPSSDRRDRPREASTTPACLPSSPLTATP